LAAQNDQHLRLAADCDLERALIADDLSHSPGTSHAG
jgi:hypothetical protein